MTKPEDFYVDALKSLRYLDTVLPAGSHMSLFGVADGRVLYDNMATRIHPVGQTFQDVTYAAFYDYLNCLETSVRFTLPTTTHPHSLAGVG